MEEELDRIEAASTGWVAVLEEFYGPFDESLKRAAAEMVHAKAETQPSRYSCEACGKPMVYRFSRNGRYLACTGYPGCKTTHPVDRDGKKLEKQLLDLACPKCGQAMQLRRGRFGPFVSCSRYPDCDGILKLDRRGAVRMPAAPPLAVDLPCPKCGGALNLRRSRRGPWLACSKFPKCRARLSWSGLAKDKQQDLLARLQQHEQANPQPALHKLDGTAIGPGYNPLSGQTSPGEDQAGATPSQPQPAGVNCPKCGKPMVIRTARRGPFLACTGFPRCRNALNIDKLDELRAQQAPDAQKQ
jgi:DNA topoisomerase-1